MNLETVIYAAERLMFPAVLVGCACALVGAALTKSRLETTPRQSRSMSVVEFDGHIWVQGDWGSIVHHPDCECGSNK